MDVSYEKKIFLIEFLKNAPFDGWTKAAIEVTSKKLFENEHYGLILFPGGHKELASYFSNYIDEQMTDKLSGILGEPRIRDKIKNLVMLRLDLYQPFKEAIRALLKTNLNPLNIPSSLNMLWNTSDMFWRSLGDQSTDYNYYSKRILLSCVYSSSLIYWLSDNSNDHQDTAVFLEKQIDRVLELGKIKNTAKTVYSRIDKIPFLRLIIKRRKI